MGKRLLRWAWNVLTALSAVLFVAVAALWLRSHWRTDYLLLGHYRAGGGGADVAEVEVTSGAGGLSLAYRTSRWGGSATPEERSLAGLRLSHDTDGRPFYPPPPGSGPDARYGGLVYWFGSGHRQGTAAEAVAPHYAFAAPLLAPAALWAWPRWRAARRRRSRFGSCRACAYDLTGNTSGVCPECGAAAPKGVRP